MTFLIIKYPHFILCAYRYVATAIFSYNAQLTPTFLVTSPS